MHRSYIILLCLASIIVSCSKDFKTADRRAVSPGRVPVYKELDDLKTQTVFAHVPVGTPVYFTDDRSLVDSLDYVKIQWNDSTAWAKRDHFMLNGKLAVITSDQIQAISINIYGKADMSKWLRSIHGSFTLVAADSAGASTTHVLYWADSPGYGYVPNNTVLKDSMDVVFYKEYKANDGKSAQSSLLTDPRYQNSKLAQFIASPKKQGIYKRLAAEDDN